MTGHRRAVTPSPRALFLALALALAGCDPVAPAGAPCTRWETRERVNVDHLDQLDVLVVLDPAAASARRAAFFDALPQLLDALVTGELRDDPGPEFFGARSLHVGMITGDLGSMGHPVPGCMGDGDAGELLTAGDPRMPGCAASYPPFHVVERDGRPATEVAAELACRAAIADGACPIQQPLEATLRALSPDTIANAGFLRERSGLVILIVTDRDDCSVADARLFDPDDASLGEPSLRCGLHPELLHPIDRYVAGLAAVRPTERRLIVASIAGVPIDALGPPGERPDYLAILAHPDMELRVDPAEPTRFVPSCHEPVAGDAAAPPRRLLALGARLGPLGVRTIAPSICETVVDLGAVVRTAADQLGGSCISDSLSAVGSLLIDGCTLTETLPPDRRCEDEPGRTHLRVSELDGEGRAECLLRALTRDEALAGEPGWYHERGDDPLPGSILPALCGTSASRIEVVGGKVLGSTVRMYCPRSIGPDGGTCH